MFFFKNHGDVLRLPCDLGNRAQRPVTQRRTPGRANVPGATFTQQTEDIMTTTTRTKTQSIALTLLADDAEPILRQAAEDAAKFGAFLDYITRRTWSAPGGGDTHEERRAYWQKRFLKAKRMVEAFGVEYEQTSEGETLTVYVPDKVLKSHLVKMAGITFRHVDKSEPDHKRAGPAWRRGHHEEACRQAAARVVRRWRESLGA